MAALALLGSWCAPATPALAYGRMGVTITEIHDGNDPPPNGPDGLPSQPAVSAGCEAYPNPDLLPGAACP